MLAEEKKNTPMKFLDIGLKICGSKNAFESSHEQRVEMYQQTSTCSYMPMPYFLEPVVVQFYNLVCKLRAF